VLDLDDLATRQAVEADPAFFITAPEPICIDEFQHVLPILDAIKAELNRDLRPESRNIQGNAVASTRFAVKTAVNRPEFTSSSDNSGPALVECSGIKNGTSGRGAQGRVRHLSQVRSA
jgi:hypothetical protein